MPRKRQRGRNQQGHNRVSKQSSNNPQQPKKTSNNFFNGAIKMLSDWHIGSGAGRPGDIDRLVIRDFDELPYIPAKTLTGMWRDACEQVAWGLDNDTTGIWGDWVNFLFGDQPALNQEAQTAIEAPRSAALSIRAAFLPEKLKEAIINSNPARTQALKSAITFVKPGISIDIASGCAEENHLRYEEMVRGGTVLNFKYELNVEGLDQEQKNTVYALLIAGTKLLERIGGKRRRGSGKCCLTITDIQGGIELPQNYNYLEWIEDWIEKKIELSSPPSILQNTRDSEIFRKKTGKENQDNKEHETNENSWETISITIKAISPVIIKSRTLGNIVETLDYIPGSLLLPIICKKLGALGIDVKSAIAKQQFIMTNATVEIDKKPGRPVPLALFYEKLGGGFDKGKGVYNLFIDDEPNDKQLKGYRQGYVGELINQKQKNKNSQANLDNSNQSKLPNYAKVEKVLGTHNTIEDVYQSPTKDVGGVYTYQAIAPGTTLQAQLRMRKFLVTQDQKLWNKLKVQERIGQSKKDDYGLVELKTNLLKKRKNSTQDINQEKDLKELVVWLLSDTLLRSKNLRPSISIENLKQTLQSAINQHQPLSEIRLIKTEKNYIRQRRTESWQKRWGLPRPSLAGLMAGSCMIFKVKGNLNPQTLAQIEITGIGERCTEGYGQICFNDILLTKKLSKLRASDNQSEAGTSSREKKPISDQNYVYDYAHIIEKQAWQEAIKRAALTIAAQPSLRQEVLGICIEGKESYPSMSQLGNLRSVISKLIGADNRNFVIACVNKIVKDSESKEEKSKPSEKWINTDNSHQKIPNLLGNHHQIWQQLNHYTNLPLKHLTLTKNAESVLKQELWAEAVRTLIYECIHAHKRDWEQGQKSQTEKMEAE